MNKKNNKLWLVIALSLFANCANSADASNTNANTNTLVPAIASVKIDTLCIYEHHYQGPSGTRVFKNNAHLISFLDSTGYKENDNYRTIKKMEHQLDFNKWIYFATAGMLDWRGHPKIEIQEKKDTITINYVMLVPPTPRDQKCPAYAPPLMIDYIYSIPFTGKIVDITLAAEHFECSCGRH